MDYTKDTLAETINRCGYEVGDFSRGRPDIFDWGDGKTLKIGRFCSIADGTRIFLGGNHRTEFSSTYPFLTSEGWTPTHGVRLSTSKGDVVIGNDVRIEVDSAIMSGVNIGDGALVAAGSRVTKSVAPYAIVEGNPAQFVAFRFDEGIRLRLAKIKWWDWPTHILAYMHPLLSSEEISIFVDLAETIQDRLISSNHGLVPEGGLCARGSRPPI